MRGYSSVTAARRTFHLLILLRYLPIGLYIPVFVLYLTAAGLNLTEVGLVIAVQSAVVLLLELPTGGLADSWGRRPVLACSSIASLAGMTVLLAADSVALFAVAFALQGIFRALDSGPLESWYVDTAQGLEPGRAIDKDLSRAGGITFAAVAVGSMSASGLTLVDQQLFDPLALPLLAFLGCEALHLLSVLILLRESRPRRDRGTAREAALRTPGTVAAALRLGWSGRSLRLVLAVEISWGLGLAACEILWQPRTRLELSGPDDLWLFGVMSAGGWLAGAAGSLLLPLLVRALRGRLSRAAALMRVLQGATLAVLGLAGGLVGVVVGFVAFYVIHGAANPAHNALLHHRVSTEHRSTVLSLNSLVSQGSGIPAGLVFGGLADAVGVPVSLAVAGVVLITATPLYLLSGEPPQPSEPDTPPADQDEDATDRSGSPAP